MACLPSPQHARGDHLCPPGVPLQLPAVGLECPAKAGCHGRKQRDAKLASRRQERRRQQRPSGGRVSTASDAAGAYGSWVWHEGRRGQRRRASRSGPRSAGERWGSQALATQADEHRSHVMVRRGSMGPNASPPPGWRRRVSGGQGWRLRISGQHTADALRHPNSMLRALY